MSDTIVIAWGYLLLIVSCFVACLLAAVAAAMSRRSSYNRGFLHGFEAGHRRALRELNQVRMERAAHGLHEAQQWPPKGP